jgi:hypothetical protein
LYPLLALQEAEDEVLFAPQPRRARKRTQRVSECATQRRHAASANAAQAQRSGSVANQRSACSKCKRKAQTRNVRKRSAQRTMGCVMMRCTFAVGGGAMAAMVASGARRRAAQVRAGGLAQRARFQG